MKQTSADIDPSPSRSEIRHSRRVLPAVLLGTAVLFAAYSHPKSTDEPSGPGHPAATGSFINPYTGGEALSVLPGLRARYDGINLSFSLSAIDRFLHDSVQHHDHEFVKITLHNGPNVSQHIWIENGQGLDLPDPFSDTQYLKCDPPPPAHECRLTVTDQIHDNYSKPGITKERYETFAPRYFRSKAGII